MSSGFTSQSPASSWTTVPRLGETLVQTTSRQIYEKLELPGVLMDYHFILSGGAQVLMREQQDEFWIFGEVEKFFLFDIRLMQSYPKMMFVENGKPGYLRATSFDNLIHLYEREGYLQEAFSIAQIAIQFNQQHKALERISARLKNLEAEAMDEHATC